MKKEFPKRILILVLCVGLVFSVFILRLAQWQLVDGEKNRELSVTTSSDTAVITAARGDIVDRYGRTLATTRLAFNVTLNKSFLKDENLNSTILSLIEILNASGESWQDSTPMEKTAPYTFLADAEGSTTNQTAVEKLKKNLGLNVYATEQNVLDKMTERYQLQEVPEEMRRTVGGIRYEMELREYGYSNPFIFATDVSIKTVSVVKEHSMDMPGVSIVEESTRSYPDGTLLPHVLGMVGPIYKEEYQELKSKGYKMSDFVGKSGLEKAMESELKGTDGLMQIQRSSTGEVISQSVVQEPVPGNTVVLTIDKYIQEAAQTSLENMIHNLQTTRAAKDGKEADAGAVVVIDVKTGGILAMATYPSYDLNLYNQNYSIYASDPQNPLFNRAIQGTYRPGSTFKCAVATAALMSGEINASSTVTCNHVYTYWADTGFTPKCTGTHGTINVVTAIQKSCNIFFYDVGRRIGIDAFNKVAAQYGLGEATGIEIPEQLGALTSKERTEAAGGQWQEGNVVQAAIGQMDTAVTPLQLAIYASTIANRGTRYSAHLVQAVRSYDYLKTISETQSTVLDKIDAAPWVFETVEKGMVAASGEVNAATILGNYPITIATKTGTAQVPGDLYNGIIIGYGPVGDPEIAVAAVVEKGSNGYRLAQIVKDVFDAYYFSENEGLTVQPGNTLLP